MNDSEVDQLLNTWAIEEAPERMRDSVRAQFHDRRPRRFLGVRTRWIFTLAAATAALALGASLVQDGTIMSDSGRWDDTTYVQRTRMVHPLLAKFVWSSRGGLSTGWKRQGDKLVGSVYMLDKSTQTHYGYTWNAEPAGNGQFRFTVLPLDPAVLKEPGPIAPAPRSIPPAILGPGSAFEVELYSSGNERVFDRYELSQRPLPPPVLDNPNVITLTRPQLFVDGVFTLDSGGVVEAGGERVTVQLKNRGEYSLTLDPRGDTRFVLAGTAKDNTLEFRTDGEVFRIACTAPVTRGGERSVYLYVKKDANQGASGFGGGGGPQPPAPEGAR